MAQQKERKYVVYPKDSRRPHGPEVVAAYVEIVGKQAFVRRKPDSLRAEVVSSGVVFDTKEAAQAYIAGGGKKMWVVGEVSSKGYDIPMMFQALVIHYTYIGKFWPERDMSVKRLSNGEPVKFNSYRNVSVHPTKKEAEKAFAKLWHHEHHELVKKRDRYNAHIALMQQTRPRSRKAAVSRKKP